MTETEKDVIAVLRTSTGPLEINQITEKLKGRHNYWVARDAVLDLINHGNLELTRDLRVAIPKKVKDD